MTAIVEMKRERSEDEGLVMAGGRLLMLEEDYPQWGKVRSV
jgi:hypothetical protein